MAGRRAPVAVEALLVAPPAAATGRHALPVLGLRNVRHVAVCRARHGQRAARAALKRLEDALPRFAAPAVALEHVARVTEDLKAASRAARRHHRPVFIRHEAGLGSAAAPVGTPDQGQENDVVLFALEAVNGPDRPLDAACVLALEPGPDQVHLAVLVGENRDLTRAHAVLDEILGEAHNHVRLPRVRLREAARAAALLPLVLKPSQVAAPMPGTGGQHSGFLTIVWSSRFG